METLFKLVDTCEKVCIKIHNQKKKLSALSFFSIILVHCTAFFIVLKILMKQSLVLVGGEVYACCAMEFIVFSLFAILIIRFYCKRKNLMSQIRFNESLKNELMEQIAKETEEQKDKMTDAQDCLLRTKYKIFMML